jgi:hypothetical protein
LNSRPVVPEVRTTRRFAIAMSVLAVGALALALLFGDQLEDPLTSDTAALVVLAVWCVAGAAAAITAIVDAYVRPEGELLSLITSIAAAVFGVLALVVVIGIVVGATGVVDEESPADTRLRTVPNQAGFGGL